LVSTTLVREFLAAKAPQENTFLYGDFLGNGFKSPSRFHD